MEKKRKKEKGWFDIDRSGIRSAYLGVKVQVRLGVDTQVLAEKRGEVQDPFVNLDNLVGRQLSARLRAALRRSFTVIRDGRRVQPRELGDDELDRVQPSVDARGGFACEQNTTSVKLPIRTITKITKITKK